MNFEIQYCTFSLGVGTLKKIVPIRPNVAIQNPSSYSESREILRLLDGLNQEKRRKIFDLIKLMANGQPEKPAMKKPVHPPSRDRRGLLVKDPKEGGFLHVVSIGGTPVTTFESATQRSKMLLGPTGAVIGVKIGRYTPL